MRAVIQRVLQASVKVDGAVIGEIQEGLLVLLGLHRDDTQEDEEYIINKMLGLRIFDDERGIMNRSVEDVGGEILVVSQFTLCGDARKGKRPSYSEAMAPKLAGAFYESFLVKLKERYPLVASGSFGAYMHVSLVNDGPVSILLDSSRIL